MSKINQSLAVALMSGAFLAASAGTALAVTQDKNPHLSFRSGSHEHTQQMESSQTSREQVKAETLAYQKTHNAEHGKHLSHPDGEATHHHMNKMSATSTKTRAEVVSEIQNNPKTKLSHSPG